MTFFCNTCERTCCGLFVEIIALCCFDFSTVLCTFKIRKKKKDPTTYIISQSSRVRSSDRPPMEEEQQREDERRIHNTNKKRRTTIDIPSLQSLSRRDEENNTLRDKGTDISTFSEPFSLVKSSEFYTPTTTPSIYNEKRLFFFYIIARRFSR